MYVRALVQEGIIEKAILAPQKVLPATRKATL